MNMHNIDITILSVCQWHVGTVSKRLNRSSKFLQHCRAAASSVVPQTSMRVHTRLWIGLDCAVFNVPANTV